MKEKITLRDIANEAGVSTATVSYVLNNRDDQCISEATRKKVLQIVNLYGYKINFSAKCISSGKTNIIGLYLGHGQFALKRAEYMFLIRRLTKHLNAIGQALRVIDNTNTSKLDYCDAIICCDQEESFFRIVSDVNFCPLIALDMLYNDPLFCQINCNYEKIKNVSIEIFGTEDFTVICHELYSTSLKKELIKTFNNLVFVDSFEDINKINNIKNTNIVALGEMLGQYCKSLNKNTLAIDICSYEKMDKLLECLDKTINKKGDVLHDIRV